MLDTTLIEFQIHCQPKAQDSNNQHDTLEQLSHVKE
jgi:hypothetical protein